MNRRTFVASSAAAMALAGSVRSRLVNAQDEITWPANVSVDFQVVFVSSASAVIDELDPNNLPTDLPPDSGVTYPLTQRGVTQANALVGFLNLFSAKAIYSSTLLRGVQTADVLSFSQAVPIQLDSALNDPAFAAPGTSVSSFDFPAIGTTITAWANGNLDASVPGGESMTQVMARFLPSVMPKIQSHAATDAGEVVFVSHPTTLTYLLPYVFPGLPDGWAANNPIGYTGYAIGTVLGNELVCIDWNGAQPA